MVTWSGSWLPASTRTAMSSVQRRWSCREERTPLTVAVQQHAQQELGVVGGMAVPVIAVRPVQGAKVELVDDLGDEPGEVAVGQPVAQVRGEQERLVAVGTQEVVGHDRGLAAVVDAVGLPVLHALPGSDVDHPQRGDWVGPPPADQGVQPKAGQQDRRQPHAQHRLGRISLQSLAAQLATDPPLGPGQQRHHQQRHHRQHDPGQALGRARTQQQGPQRLDPDAHGEQEKGDRDQPDRPPLGSLGNRTAAALGGQPHSTTTPANTST